MSKFATIHTTVGLAAMSAAQAGGTPINLTHMAVGDGNGNPVTPDAAQTALVREVYRAAINRVFKPDPVGQPTKFAVELVVPAAEGGFVMREVGVFDADGSLFVVGNLPETYKPEASEGAFADTIVRVEFVATNSDVVTVQVDPNVAVATQQWVTNNVTAATIIPGGTTQQVLRKVSNADGDYEWSDATDANVTVSTIEERQTLAAGQTVVTLAVVNTVGLALYIEGVRLPIGAGAGEWEPDPIDVTSLTLGQAYPAGTQLLAVQNEPAGSLPDALRKDQNLADVPNKAQARTNLDIYSRAEVDQRAPPGLIGHFARSTAPAGWLKANGAEISRTVYQALFNAIGTTFGAGNGVDTFNLPDLRGEFLRAWDDARGVDAGRAFASAQAASLTYLGAGGDNEGFLQSIDVANGTANYTMSSAFRPLPISYDGYFQVGSMQSSAAYQWTPGSDAFSPRWGQVRPRNIALLACIKF